MTSQLYRQRKIEQSNKRVSRALKDEVRRPQIRRVIRDTAPTVADNLAAGFEVFSEWLDTSTENIYRLVNAVAGIWKQIT